MNGKGLPKNQDFGSRPHFFDSLPGDQGSGIRDQMSGIRNQGSGIRKSYRRLCRRRNVGARGFTSFHGASRR
ncbi:MAG: hypothetical protein LBI62_06325 [Candidatus Accumulibacter sp.]|nr:hypothetical protein [Accumulibacter sp.]